MKTGAGRSGEKFDLVYVCSLVADVHYTLFKGGIAMNPRCATAPRGVGGEGWSSMALAGPLGVSIGALDFR